MVRYIAALIFMVFCVHAEASQERYEQVENALHEKLSVRLRAMNEIEAHISDEAYQKILVDYLFSDIFVFYEEAVLDRICTKVTNAAANQIIQRYRKHPDEETFFKVCIALEKIGGKWDRPDLFYLEESKRTPLSTKKQAWLRVCFANHGVDPERNLKQLKLDLQNFTLETTKEEVYLMSRIGCQDYADEEIIEALIRGLSASDDIDTACYSAVALASLGKKASHKLKILEKHTREPNNLNQDSDSGDINRMVINNMCIAAVDEKQLSRRVRSALCYIGNEDGIDQTGHAAITLVCDSLMNDTIQEGIEGGLSDSDLNVVRGALHFVYGLGFACKDSKEKLLELLKNSEDEQVRGLSARALSMVMEQGEAETLEKILKKEISKDVQQEIRNSIQVINMEPPFTESGKY